MRNSGLYLAQNCPDHPGTTILALCFAGHIPTAGTSKCTNKLPIIKKYQLMLVNFYGIFLNYND